MFANILKIFKNTIQLKIILDAAQTFRNVTLCVAAVALICKMTPEV